MSVILRQRKNKGSKDYINSKENKGSKENEGTKKKIVKPYITLRLDIYHNGQRSIETLKHLRLSTGSSPVDRENNKKILQQAEAIRATREAELEANSYSMVTDAGKKTDVVIWMQSYVNCYTLKDKRNMQGVLNRFSDYLIEENKQGLTFGNLNALLIEDFIDYLENKSKGEGAASYYRRFKKMLKQAFRKNLMKDNILDYVERKVKGKAGKKDILTLEELKKLAATTTESSEVKRAFLFSCVTGLRWCDIKALTWQSIDLDTKQMSVKQSKTGEVVATPLNSTAIKLLGEAKEVTDTVFVLPTANGANKTVKAWVNRAKINKAITWHNARHSFGTNLIFNDVDVLTASKLLGHTSMKHTQRYVDTAAEMKQKATDKVNIEL